MEEGGTTSFFVFFLFPFTDRYKAMLTNQTERRAVCVCVCAERESERVILEIMT